MSMPAQNPLLKGDGSTANINEFVDPALIAELSQLVIDALNLEVSAAEIDPDAPIYGDGLGLDSIDILEIAMVVSKKYGFQLRSDDEKNVVIFRSMRSLAEHISANRTK